MRNLIFRAIRSSAIGIVLMSALLFISAGTLDYWQAWVFMAVFVAASVAITAYLAINDPALLERRMRAGPRAEKEAAQKIAMVFALCGFIAALVIPALDRRFGWSDMPPWLSWVGEVLVVLGFMMFFVVVRENSYSASTVQIFESQTVVSTGPYAVVRHPMYSGALLLMAGMPLALASWWGFVAFAIMMVGLVWRLIGEESFLSKNLPGYIEYKQRVRARLIPGVF